MDKLGAEYQFDNSLYGSNSYKTNTNSSSDSKTKTGLQESLMKTHLLDSALKAKDQYQRDDSDSIFRILSKAYYRNLDLILERANNKKEKNKDKRRYDEGVPARLTDMPATPIRLNEDGELTDSFVEEQQRRGSY